MGILSETLKLMPSMLGGLKHTLIIALITIVLSLPLGLLVAMIRLSSVKFMRYLTAFYITLMRGTPLLLQLMVVYFGLPYLGIVYSRWEAVIIAFVLNYAAYFGEIFRGGINAIDRSQFEAFRVLRIKKTCFVYRIMLPQMIKITLPSVSNEIITLIKDTSLVYVLGVGELLRAGKIAANTSASLLPFFVVGIIYLIVIGAISKILKGAEKRLDYYS